MKRYLCLALLASSLAHGQNGTSRDARDPHEAAAMLYSKVRIAEAMGVLCGTKFPELRSQIQTNLTKWKRADDRAIKRAEALWAEMEMVSPQPEAEKPDYQAGARQLFAQLSGQSAGSSDRSREYCSAHFSQLAAGLWRRQRPNMYKLLESR